MNNLGASPANQPYLPFDSLSLGEERGKLYQNKDWLYQKYVIEKLSTTEITIIVNSHRSVIFRWLKKFGIKTRTPSEALKGRVLSEEWKRKISETKIKNGESKGEKNPMYGIHLYGKKNHFWGKKHSEESKRKMSISSTGKIHSEKTKEVWSQQRKGKKKSEKWKNDLIIRQTFYTIKQEKRTIELYQAGLFMEDIRKELDLGLSTVETCLRRNGISTRKGWLISEKQRLKLYESLRLTQKLKPNPNWRGGKSFEPYGLEFNTALRRLIRERDNYTCQMCDVRENGRAHSCHHVDYNKKNNCPSNLVLLCPYCHSITNGNRFLWESYFKSKKLLSS